MTKDTEGRRADPHLVAVEGKSILKVVIDTEFYHRKMRFIMVDGSEFVVQLEEDDTGEESFPYLYYYFKDIE